MSDSELTIEVPHLILMGDIMNKHMALITADTPPLAPTVNDEMEILTNLMGLSRIIEYNMRVAFEKLNLHHELNLPAPNRFIDLINAIRPYILEKNTIELLEYVRLISNGLVHSDFKKVYINSEKAYDITDTDFNYKKFEPPIYMFKTTITKHGLNVDISKETATDSKGNPIPFKSLKPDGTNEIDVDFQYFYLTGSFIFTYDVLISAYKASVLFKEQMKQSIGKKRLSKNNN